MADLLTDLDTLAKTADTGERWMGDTAVRAKAEIMKLRALVKQGADCLEDVARGRGTWAWEDVLSEMHEALE